MHLCFACNRSSSLVITNDDDDHDNDHHDGRHDRDVRITCFNS